MRTKPYGVVCRYPKKIDFYRFPTSFAFSLSRVILLLAVMIMTAASAIIAAQAAKPTPAFKKSSRLACSAVSLKVAIIKTVRDAYQTDLYLIALTPFITANATVITREITEKKTVLNPYCSVNFVNRLFFLINVFVRDFIPGAKITIE